MEDQIKSFISENMMVDFDDDLDENSDLFQLGIIDSMGYIHIIKFIESKFNIKFTEDELLSSISVSVSGLAALVRDKVST